MTFKFKMIQNYIHKYNIIYIVIKAEREPCSFPLFCDILLHEGNDTVSANRATPAENEKIKW